jgi:hypothetical protein
MSFRSPAHNSSLRKELLLWRRHQAQRKLQKAVARGIITKPNNCQRCQNPFPKHKLHGHHRDYRKPLQGIKWYCQACHYKQHSKRFQERALYNQMRREAGLIGH